MATERNQSTVTRHDVTYEVDGVIYKTIVQSTSPAQAKADIQRKRGIENIISVKKRPSPKKA